MLASLLPGLRELRAPLGAGSLWLVTAFVALRALTEGEVRFPALRPVIDSFSALGSAIDETWGAGVVLSFTAFLVGALSHGFVTDVLQSWAASVSDKGRRSIDLVARQRIGTLVDALDVDHLMKVRASTVDPVLVSAIEYALNGGGAHQDDATTNGEIVHRRDEEEKKRNFLIEKKEVELLKGGDDAWRSLVRSDLENSVPLEIEAELPSVATRLIGTEQGLFDQYDRLRAEAEFRMSLVPPMAALALTIAFVAFPWISILIAFVELVILAYLIFELIVWIDLADFIGPVVGVLVGIAILLGGGVNLFDQTIGELLGALATIAVLLGVPAAILVQGMKIQRAAGDLLADAIFVGRVMSPLLERLTAAIIPGELPTGTAASHATPA